MPIPLLIIDGVLVMTVVVGAIEATALPLYRFTFGRWVRAVSLPVAISVLLHILTAYDVWRTILKALNSLGLPAWMVTSVLMVVFVALVMLGIPLGVGLLAWFVGAQFLTGSVEDLNVPTPRSQKQGMARPQNGTQSKIQNIKNNKRL